MSKNAHMETTNESGEKIAGTNLTPIAEYSKTALAMADLRSRYSGLVFELDSPAKIKEAKKSVAEVRGYRTALEDERKRIKAPALERCRLIDAEAQRLTADLRELEDPMKAQIDAKEAEIEAERIRVAQAEQARVDGHRDAIQHMRDFPLSLHGKPADVIELRIREFETNTHTQLEHSDFEEFQDQAGDAFGAALLSARDILQRQRDHEAEQERVKAERAELDRMRAENERLQREAQERQEADARREREEREAAERKEREAKEAEEAAERARLKAIDDAKEAQRQEELRQQRLAEQMRLEAQRQAQEAQAEAQRQEQARLDQQRREHEAQVERDRIAKLGLMEAVKAVVDFYDCETLSAPKCVTDLITVYHALPSEKRSAAKPVKKPRTQS